jgi:hypothetical protein
MTEFGITGTGEIVTEDELRDRLTAELDAMEPAPPTATAPSTISLPTECWWAPNALRSSCSASPLADAPAHAP